MDINALVDAVIDRLSSLPGAKLAFIPNAPVPDLPNWCVTLDFDRDEPIAYDQTLGQATHYVYLSVLILFGRRDDETAHRRLNQFLGFPGALSVKAILEADQTLGGLTASCLPQNPKNGGPQVLPDNRIYLGITVPVQLEAYT